MGDWNAHYEEVTFKWKHFVISFWYGSQSPNQNQHTIFSASACQNVCTRPGGI